MFDFSNENGLLRGSNGAENAIGHYAVSLAGHDSGKIYLVVGHAGGAGKAELLLLCDGKARPFGRPKVKKRMHVTVLREMDDGIAASINAGERVDDSVLIHSLRGFRKGRSCD